MSIVLLTALISAPPASHSGALGSDTPEIIEFLERARFEDALPKLRECRESQLVLDPEAAISCGLVMAGILRVQGRVSEWAESMIWFREKGLLASGDGEETLVYKDRYDGRIDFQSAMRKNPTEVVVPRGAFFMPTPSVFDRSDIYDSENHYLLPIAASEGETIAVVDTGSVDLIRMSAEKADRLGIVDVIGETSPYSRPFSGVSPSGGEQYRFAPFLKIGSVSYSNALVRVDSENRIKNTVVGSGFLSNFSNIRFSRNGIWVNEGYSAPKCDRITYRFAASPYLTRSNFIFDAFYMGDGYKAVLDTGMAATLGFVNPLARRLEETGLPEFTPHVLDGDASPFKVSSQKIQVGSVEISDATSLLFFRSSPSEYQIVLGGGAKKAVDIRLDLQNGYFCFLPPG